MANQKEKLALGAALAAGIAGYIYTQTIGTEGEETKKIGENNFPENKIKIVVEIIKNASNEDSKEASKDVKTEIDDIKIEIKNEEDDTSTKTKTSAEPMDDEEKEA